MRRFIVSVSTMLAAALTAVMAMATAAPAAFAINVVPEVDGSTTVPPTHPGLAGWEIALITIAATVAFVAVSAFVFRLRRRHSLRPLTS